MESEPENEQIEIGKNRVPVVAEGLDLNRLRLLPKDGFILSQIDGRITVEQLRQIANVQEKELERILTRFFEKGMIVFRDLDEESDPEASVRSASVPLSDDDRALDKKVADLYINIDNMDYFSLFGLDLSATADDIKKSFHQLSKEYHPDKLFRRGSDEVRERLQYIFAKINTAYKVLSNDKTRWEYEKSLGPRKPLPRKAAPVKPAPSDPSPPPKKPTAPPKPPPKAPTPPANNPFTQTVLKAKKMYDGALVEIKKKNYANAKNNLRIAMTLDPFNKVYPETLRKIDSIESKDQAQKHYQEGMAREKDGKYDEAVKSYREATLLDGQTPKYYTKWARVLVENKNNASQAKSIIQKAFDLDNKDPEQYLVMGIVLKELGQRPQAQAKFEQGLKIDPENKDLNKELKKIKKGK